MTDEKRFRGFASSGLPQRSATTPLRPPPGRPASGRSRAGSRRPSKRGGLDNEIAAGLRPWLGEAAAGYGLLGLDAHATLTDRLAAALDDGFDVDAREDLEEDWFAEVGSNSERSAWIAAHPEDFRA